MSPEGLALLPAGLWLARGQIILMVSLLVPYSVVRCSAECNFQLLSRILFLQAAVAEAGQALLAAEMDYATLQIRWLTRIDYYLLCNSSDQAC
jgi:hypothetical protein